MPDIASKVGANLDALVQELDLIANNVANASTAGYKRRTNSFSKILEAQQTADYPKPDEDEEPKPVSIIDFRQGNLKHTERNFDFALYGEGFFEIETEDGPLYTRNGSFNTNSNSQIVDGMGRIVAGKTGAITIPSEYSLSQVSVSDKGVITANGLPIDEFKIVKFKEEDVARLVPIGGNCFVKPEDAKTTKALDVVVK